MPGFQFTLRPRTYLTVKFEAKDFAAVAREFVPHNVTCKADYGQGLDADASVCREKAAGP